MGLDDRCVIKLVISMPMFAEKQQAYDLCNLRNGNLCAYNVAVRTPCEFPGG